MGASKIQRSHFADPGNKGSNDLIHLDLYNIGVPHLWKLPYGFLNVGSPLGPQG